MVTGPNEKGLILLAWHGPHAEPGFAEPKYSNHCSLTKIQGNNPGAAARLHTDISYARA